MAKKPNKAPAFHSVPEVIDLPTFHDEPESQNNPVKSRGHEQTDYQPVQHPVKKGKKVRRYRQKSYSIMDEDIDRIHRNTTEIRNAGHHERGRSDIVRAAILAFDEIPLNKKIEYIQKTTLLRNN